jgi:acyl-CoA reductase-like NAD-dependent aldehyde dehydrogenase
MEAKTAATEQATNGANGSDTGEAAPAADVIEVRRPTNGSLIREVPIDSPERVAEIVARVRSNQPAWEALGIEGRYEWLGRLRNWLLDNADELAMTLKEETGKVLGDAELEAPYVAGVINFYGENAADYLSETVIKGRTPMT